MPKSTKKQNKEEIIQQLEDIAEYPENQFTDNTLEILHKIDKFGEYHGVLVHICNLIDWRGQENKVILDTENQHLTVRWDNQTLTKYYDYIKCQKVESYWEDQYTSQ